MLILQSDRFKGKLVELIGLDKRTIMQQFSPPSFTIVGENAERFSWIEWALDDETNERIPLFFFARLYQGTTWAVGIGNEKLLLLTDINEQGQPYFYATPKGPEHGRTAVNWVCKKDGRYYNLGVSA